MIYFIDKAGVWHILEKTVQTYYPKHRKTLVALCGHENNCFMFQGLLVEGVTPKMPCPRCNNSEQKGATND